MLLLKNESLKNMLLQPCTYEQSTHRLDGALQIPQQESGVS